MRITRLSEGVDGSGTLSASAQERVLGVLGEFRQFMDDAEVLRGLLVATAAVRDATNGAAFLDDAAQVVGFAAECLTGDQEARFSLLGALRDLAPSPVPTMIVDIGGGSTELAAMVDAEVVAHSMQLGCVRVTERALHAGVVTAERAEAARVMIASELERAFRETPRLGGLVGNVRLVGLAGTVATLAQLVSGRTTYQRAAVHHQVLTRQQVGFWRDELARRTPAERLTLPGMVPGREDVLTAGLFILDAVCERFAVESFLTSEDDILDGVATSLRGSVS
jgi:exopolyphosphatase/guanosine-5'-triphosphate,3'-diphosphate pyrophosphatase